MCENVISYVNASLSLQGACGRGGLLKKSPPRFYDILFKADSFIGGKGKAKGAITVDEDTVDGLIGYVDDPWVVAVKIGHHAHTVGHCEQATVAHKACSRLTFTQHAVILTAPGKPIGGRSTVLMTQRSPDHTVKVGANAEEPGDKLKGSRR